VAASLTIGDFSQITHLSIKTLRRYHEAGLLDPAEVDPQTGYRYYTVEQIPTAQVIHRFRELGMPVKETAEVLATEDADERAALIAHHLDRLENQLEETRVAVSSLRRLLLPDPAPIEVELRRLEATSVAAVRTTVDLADVLTWYDAAMGELDETLDAVGLVPNGPPGGLYDNELFTDERGGVLVYLPVPDPPTRGHVQPFTIPAGELAVTVHRGPHDEIDVTYGALGSYVADHTLAVAGPVHEVYLVGPRDTDDSAKWRTELGWPVFRTTPNR
jgi:DNA-binding transcriptional MerR regulator